MTGLPMAVLTALASAPEVDCAELENGIPDDCPGLLPLAGVGAVWGVAALIGVVGVIVAISIASALPTDAIGSWFEEHILGLDRLLPQTAPAGVPLPGSLPPAEAPTPGTPTEPQVAPPEIPAPGTPLTPGVDVPPGADPPPEVVQPPPGVEVQPGTDLPPEVSSPGGDVPPAADSPPELDTPEAPTLPAPVPPWVRGPGGPRPPWVDVPPRQPGPPVGVPQYDPTRTGVGVPPGTGTPPEVTPPGTGAPPEVTPPGTGAPPEVAPLPGVRAPGVDVPHGPDTPARPDPTPAEGPEGPGPGVPVDPQPSLPEARDGGGDDPTPDPDDGGDEGEPVPPEPPGSPDVDPDIQAETWVRFYLNVLPQLAEVISRDIQEILDKVERLAETAFAADVGMSYPELAAERLRALLDAFDAVDEAMSNAEGTRYDLIPGTLERFHLWLIRIPALTDQPDEVGIGHALDDLVNAAKDTNERFAKLSAALDQASDRLFPTEPAQRVGRQAVEQTDAVKDAAEKFAASATHLKDLMEGVPPLIWERLVFDPRTSDRLGPYARGLPGMVKGADDALGLLKPPKPLQSATGNGWVAVTLLGVLAWKYGKHVVDAAWERISGWWSSGEDGGPGDDTAADPDDEPPQEQ